MTAAVHVVVGGDEFLVSREIAAYVATVRRDHPDAIVSDHDVADGGFDEQAEFALSSPDLFGGARVVVISGAEHLSDQQRAAVLAVAGDPLPEIFLVVAQGSGNKARGFPAELAARAGVEGHVPGGAGSALDRLQFVQDEIRAAGGEANAGAVRALCDAVGTDLRELAAAARQLVADTGGRVDESAVARFHQGRAGITGFAVADAVVAGQCEQALALLRGALDTGTAPVLVTSALAGGLRDIARVREARGPVAGIAKALALPPWKVERAQRQARGWTDDGLAAAITAVARADAGVKGADVDARQALQQAILAVADARSSAAPRADSARAGRTTT